MTFSASFLSKLAVRNSRNGRVARRIESLAAAAHGASPSVSVFRRDDAIRAPALRSKFSGATAMMWAPAA